VQLSSAESGASPCGFGLHLYLYENALALRFPDTYVSGGILDLSSRPEVIHIIRRVPRLQSSSEKSLGVEAIVEHPGVHESREVFQAIRRNKQHIARLKDHVTFEV
jgi:hypothetical protein